MKTLVIPSADIQLQAAVIAPEKPKAVVVLVHGMAEHKERYYPFMTYLSEMGFACLIYDQRGHGATAVSPEELGFFGRKGPEALIQDSCTVVRRAREEYPGLPVFLFGHSMGSLVVRCYARRYDSEIDGLVVCGSPSANPVAGMGILLTRIIQLFKGIRYRSKTLAVMMFGPYEKKFKAEAHHNSWLSSNRANVEAYNNDPLCGFKFTVGGYRTVMQLIRQTYSRKGWQVNHPAMPVHFVAGSNDPCIGSIRKFSRAVSFFRSRGYRQVTSKVYPGLRHEILNELGREDVFRDLASVLQSWL